MASLNKTQLIGRVGANPELKNLDGGSKVVNFSMATSETFKDKAGVKQQKTEWHNIVAWNEKADLIAKYVTKGSLIYVEGKSTTRSWDDKDGNKKYMNEVVVNTIEFLDSKKAEGDTTTAETSTSTNSAPASKQTPKAPAKTTKTAAPVTPDGDIDDLPF